MSFRSFVMITVSLLVSLPTLIAQAGEKSSHPRANRSPASISASQPRIAGAVHKDKELNRIYQSLIRDSQKQLTPSISEHSVYLPTSVSSVTHRSLASDQNGLPMDSRHAAMPWAASTAMNGAVFSVK